MLQKEIEEFNEKYDCLYMPYDYEKGGNEGCAFINFIHPLHILMFFEKFQNFRVRSGFYRKIFLEPVIPRKGGIQFVGVFFYAVLVVNVERRGVNSLNFFGFFFGYKRSFHSVLLQSRFFRLFADCLFVLYIAEKFLVKENARRMR